MAVSSITNLLKNSKKKNNDVEIYHTYNEGKSVVAKRFIRTLLKSKIYKQMTAVSRKSLLCYVK